jgi:Fic family protein
MASPIITIPRAQEVLGVTYRSAMLNIKKLVEAGILREQGAERPKFYIADEVVSLVYA